MDGPALMRVPVWKACCGFSAAAPGKDLPDGLPGYPKCWRRFVEWTTDGTLDRVQPPVIRKLDEPGQIDSSEGFADGTFASAQMGAIRSGRPAGQRDRGHGPRRRQRGSLGDRC